MMKSKKSMALVLFVFALGFAAHAQYFGRNKVQYESFDFKVLDTESFDVLYYPLAEKPATDGAKMLERWYNRLKRVFRINLPADQPVILYANHADFQQTNVISGLIPQATGGVTEGFMNRIVIPLTGVYAENDHVLGHELAHAFHYVIMRKSGGGQTAAQSLPLWFIEGMSEYLSIGSVAPLTSMWMRDAVLNDDVPSFDKISRNQEYFPYRYGHAIWGYLAGKYGDDVIADLFNTVLKRGWNRGFKSTLDISLDSVSKEWESAIKSTYGPEVKSRTKPSEIGREIITEGRLNLSPAISPDGKYIAFLSTRDVFTIDLYLADAKTGDIIDKLVSSETDEHFDALRFFNSSGAWSPDGKQFAISVFKNGDNAIAILDVESRTITRTFKVENVQEITYLAWSPDGASIVLAGTSGGISDLFLYTTDQNSVEKLTDDLYAELQPAWSPDGNTIVFATDRAPQTDFDSLVFAPMRLGFLDVATKEVRTLSIAAWSKHVNPQYSSDGESVYFVANPDGVSDLYRYSFQTEKFYRITKVATGLTGLTELSPVMSVARNTGQIVFTIFQNRDYVIHELNESDAVGEEFVADKIDYYANVTLPPMGPGGSIVNEYLGHPLVGLPPEKRFESYNYFPKLRLLYVGQLFAGVAAGGGGVGVGGGASFLFSDLLGNHLLGLSGQINGGFKDVAGEAVYLNRKHRINWGLQLSHVPSLSTTARSSTDTVEIDGQDTEVRKITLIDRRIFEDRIRLLTEYPLSTNRRFELFGGYTRISYDFDAEEFQVRGNTILDQKQTEVEEPISLDLFHGMLAYVGDYSFSAFTSPVRGRRYRFEAEQTTGSLFFLTGLADYRYYFFFRPLTFATRVMHLGRYLQDAESDRLSPFFLGSDAWVRGYNYFSFDLSGCDQDLDSCPEFNRLLGSKIAVANAELRIPILGTEQFGLFPFPYLPLELAGFFDAGIAWDEYEEFESALSRGFVTDSKLRIPVFSAGGATRINLFGVLVMQIYYAYPFQRPGEGGQWGFYLAPGW